MNPSYSFRRNLAMALCLLTALILALLAVWPTSAQQVVTLADIEAHPALWTVHGRKGTAYLFGSVHILPPQIDWHTKRIDAAIAKADVLVFEIAMDEKFQAHMQSYIQEHGMLSAGQHLRDMLSPEARADFDREIAGLPVSPQALDRMRPWLATLTIDVMDMTKQHYSARAGVEMQIENDAANRDKKVMGLETIEQQMAFLAPRDPAVELQEFEADLKSSHGGGNEIGPLLDAWTHGDVRTLARLTAADLKGFPQMRKALFDDRNKAWVKQIAALLDENKVYFITVGAGHLAGPRGVPALLRAKGFRVEGP